MSQNKDSEQERSTESITRGVDLRALRAVVAVADAGSFRRAAVLLGYTQSALSHQIAGLEKQLQAPLFTRPGGRGRVTLTRAGQAAYARARRALAEIETLSVEVHAAHRGDRATLRVGVFQTVASELLPGALRALREERPGLEVILSEVDHSEVANNLIADGRLDLALTINPVPDGRVDAIALLQDRWVILARRDNPILEASRPSFDLLDGTEMVAWTQRWPAQIELEQTWRRRGITPRIVYRTDDNLALQRLVAAGLGVACISRLAAQRAVEASLTWIEPDEILAPRMIALCHPRHRDTSAPALSLINAIRAEAGATRR